MSSASASTSSAISPRYIVGIDLGTSNTALAWVDTAGMDDKSDPPPVAMLDIDQVVSAGAVEARPLLPSSIYVRGESELPAGALNLPWRADPGWCAGYFAREQGARIPTRLIHSHKSWLCHSGIDREARILPYQSREEDAKRSPVEAATMILEHLRAAWNHRMAGGNAALDLAAQQVVLCVPASFDAVARNLTMSAAEKAGLRNVILLEEPQAAFHAWIDRAGRNWRKQARVGDIALVVDIGGGTTDFSLIAVRDAGGELELRRIAVGEHILLGGDNMDLALAYSVSERLEREKGRKLDAFQFATLVQQCRAAKEHLLDDPKAASHPLTLLGRGSSVVGGTIRTELTREGFDELLIDGFFPRCALSDRPAQPRRAGFREAGLPYAADPAITLHLARFLGRQHEAVEEFFPEAAREGRPLLPTAILFNGGVLRAKALQDRLFEVISSWCAEAGQEAPRILDGADLDLAVARGAAYLGLARRGTGVRIRGGSPRSYYIGIESAAMAVPGKRPPLKAMCVVPFGMEEGTTAEISGKEIDLCIWTGEPAVFRFLSSTTRRHDRGGELHDVAGDDFIEHSPIETTLGAGQNDSARESAVAAKDSGTSKEKSEKKSKSTPEKSETASAAAAASAAKSEGRPVEVDLRSHLTEIGTLDLYCIERGAKNEWKLEFNVRATSEE